MKQLINSLNNQLKTYSRTTGIKGKSCWSEVAEESYGYRDEAMEFSTK